MIANHVAPAIHADRRRRFMSQMEGGAALIPTSPPRTRSHDTEHRFRPDSDFFYLTGFREEGACLLLVPGHPEHQVVLFVQPKDPLKETWTGRRLGVDAAPGTLGVDVAYSIDDLESVLPTYLSGLETLYYRFANHEQMDQLVLRMLPKLATRHAPAPGRLLDPSAILHEMRLLKDPGELALMREAARITTAAYREAYVAIHPGGSETEVNGILEGAYRRLGGDGPAYTPIVAGGDNATILHYNNNDQPLRDGELLLIDSGAEFGYYACDVTRTYPVNGLFTPAQRAVYEVVLRAQEAAIDEVRPGRHVKSYHLKAIELLTEGMVELGLLKGDVKQLIETEAYRRFYMHGTGHYLGLDTHDVGRYQENGDWRPMLPGMVVTVEPGLYVPVGTPDVDPQFHGIGVRIEDDVLVTESGHENLTADIPKTVADVEAVLAAGRQLATRVGV